MDPVVGECPQRQCAEVVGPPADGTPWREEGLSGVEMCFVPMCVYYYYHYYYYHYYYY